MIGIAIPCHMKHAHHILPLLENISKSTVLPAQVVISCSSWYMKIDRSFLYNSIPVTIVYTPNIFNASQNRNIAARRLKTNFVSFFDVDDRMHPKRLEYILKALESYEAVYHSYSQVYSHTDNFVDSDPPTILTGITTHSSAWGLKLDEYPIHHAHVSVRKSIYDTFQFDESPEHHRREDSVYGRTLCTSGVQIGFLTNKLSNYLLTTS